MAPSVPGFGRRLGRRFSGPRSGAHRVAITRRKLRECYQGCAAGVGVGEQEGINGKLRLTTGHRLREGEEEKGGKGMERRERRRNGKTCMGLPVGM